ncbi:hypothetical protein M3T53_00455 [Actinomyces sp. B33]|uniref:hypothetical protein n=1 Tax=Actinomyces sp. B33 TaxID=2942131 RepID=UPI0023424079|nr:hypothetical protein [Actinomyces sp. B33]MDC4232189.1 hypothetical protein [Actinomyces sp. B33]
MTPPQHNDQNKRSTTSTHRLNPKHWTTRTKIIASIAVLALILTGVGSGFAYRAYTVERDCKAQGKVFTDQKDNLSKAVGEAHDALDSVDASVKVGEGKRLEHTDDFPLSPEGQKAITDLNNALGKAEEHSKDTAPEQCSDGKTLTALTTLTGARQADLDALKTQTATFTETVEKYRLDKATEEAETSMDTAKTDLAAAQKDATDQLAVVDGDTALQSDATVKAAYDALKSTEAESHSVSTTVTTSTYDEAVASIDKAKTVATKTAEVNTATQALKDAIKAYQDAKAVETTAAQAASGSGETSEYSGGSGSGYSSDYSGSSSSSYSGGGSYSAPAPAPSNNSSNSSSGSGGDTMIDWGDTSGELDTTPGKCWYIEGQAYCN